MRKSLSSILVIFLLISCSQQKESTSNNSENNSTNFQDSKKAQADSLDGYWLSTLYLDAIRKTKSPFESEDYANKTSFFAFRINKNRLLTDSAFLDANDLHEGGYGSYLYFDTTFNRFRSDIKKNEFYSKESFFLKPIDANHLAVKYLNKDKIEYFVKIDDNNNYPEASEVFKIIFGEKISFRNIKTDKKVIFDKDGNVSGLDSNKTFLIGTDFAGGPPHCDNISTTIPNTQKQNVYKFKFFKDTLMLIKGIVVDEYDYQFSGDTIILVKQ